MFSAFMIDFSFVLLAMTLLAFFKPQIARQTSKGKAVALFGAMSIIVFVLGLEMIKMQGGDAKLSQLESFTVTITAVILGYVIGIANSRAIRAQAQNSATQSTENQPLEAKETEESPASKTAQSLQESANDHRSL
jgi:hypothetical protein